MTKQNYLYELENCLQCISYEQRKEILSDIEEYFDMSIKEGRDEQEIITSLGFPSALARQYKDENCVFAEGNTSAEDTAAVNISTYSITGIEEINASIIAARFNIISVHENSDEIKVEITGKERSSYKVYMEGATLFIAESEGNFPFRFFRDKDIQIKLYLPDHYRNDFVINMKSGKINFDKINCGKFTLKLSSGSLSGGSVTANSIVSDIMSGNLTMGRYVAKNLEFKVSSGNIRVDLIEVPTIEMSVSSGSIKLGELLCLSSNIKCSSGALNIEAMNGDLTAKVSSGAMKINYKTLPQKIDISTSSGVAKVTLPPDSVISLKKKHISGNIKCTVPISEEAACAVNANVTSGVIKIN